MSEQPDTRIEKGQVEASAPASQQGQSSLRRLSNAPALTVSTPSPKSYPPISSIPKISPERLALASADEPSSSSSSSSTSAKTILYLAYGSNLCAETFLGRRGIRPLGQINVSAPELDLCFDLPGVPYLEPCFANSRRRRTTKPKLPLSPPRSYSSSDDEEENDDDDDDPSPGTKPKWTKGLYGVVYEVTPEDYATIIKTEGGGQGYQDVLTPCFELPSDSDSDPVMPEENNGKKFRFPDLPQPFLAHTLFAPSAIDDSDDQAATSTETTPLKRKPHHQPTLLQRLTTPVKRHFPSHAEPSPRYLNLIRTGASEHTLPVPYQAYLSSLPAYTPTSARQRIGKFVFAALAIPLLLPVFALGRLLADDMGRNPRWLGAATTACMNLLWAAYDWGFRPVFGDGERTEGRGEVDALGNGVGGVGEKNMLLKDW